MSIKKLIRLLVFSTLCFINIIRAGAQSTEPGRVNVLAYQVHLEPNFSEHYIEGSVIIRFKNPSNAEAIVFDSGQLKVTGIEGKHTKGFSQKEKKTLITLSQNEEDIQEMGQHDQLF